MKISVFQKCNFRPVCLILPNVVEECINEIIIDCLVAVRNETEQIGMCNLPTHLFNIFDRIVAHQ